MNAVGAAALFVAFLTAIYVVVSALLGTRGDSRWADSSRRAVYALCALLLIAVLSLELAFLRDDFSLALVAQNSSTTTPTWPYKLTAMWGSQAGSLLLWATVLSIAASAVLAMTRGHHREVVPWATAVMGGIAVFFTGLIAAGIAFPGAETWPFAALSPVPVEGQGLNPLLRHPLMAIHPPMLYAGYVFFTIPFAFAIGALITRRLDASWIRSTRRFALIAWVLLTIGLALGARWSYSELGWGGYWAWDPVENAALMPWLTGTAFLHSIMVQERRGMLRTWNVSLIVLTFALSLLGTFLVRSGILQSIHAFGESKVGPPLLILIATILIGSTLLIVSRLGDLRSERRIDSLASRESFFLVNNFLLVALAAVVFWGTFFPLISEALSGEESSLAAPWFNRFTTPIGIALLFVAGIGPLLAWRRVSLAGIRRSLMIPTAAAALAGLLAWLLGDAGGEPLALVLFVVAGFTIASVSQELIRGAAARRSLTGDPLLLSLGRLVARNRRRYGGYVVHAGIAVMFIGIAASSSFQTSEDLRLEPGQEARVADYTVRYVEPTESIDSAQQSLTFGAVIEVWRDGEPESMILAPSREYFSVNSQSDGAAPLRSFFEGEATSEIGRQEGLTTDVWTAIQPDLSSLDLVMTKVDRQFAQRIEQIEPGDVEAMRQLATDQGEAIARFAQFYVLNSPAANIRFNVNPFIFWLWAGIGIAVLGALLALWPGSGARRREVVSDIYAARLARELASSPG